MFEQELDSVKRLVSGNRSASATRPDEFENFLDQMIADGFEGDDLASRVESFENLMQYDESGAIVVMSAHERTIACGHVDSELTADDLPARAQYLAAELRREYAAGKRMEELWDDINTQIEVLYPVSGKTESGGRFYSHANRELQSLCREVLEAILADCQSDFHLTALRTNRTYREFHQAIRGAKDTKVIGETMKAAFQAREIGALPLKHFTALTTASKLQREQLELARPSKNANTLLQFGKRIARSLSLSVRRMPFRLLRLPTFASAFLVGVLLLQPLMEAAVGVKQALHSFVHYLVGRRFLAGRVLHVGHVLAQIGQHSPTQLERFFFRRDLVKNDQRH